MHVALQTAVVVSPPLVRVISPVPGWTTLLVTFLVGAVTALAVEIVIQLYVVPRVETRKRRVDRFERNVLELGELLTSALRHSVYDARFEQSFLRMLRDREYGPELDRASVARGITEQAAKARQATSAFTDLVHSRYNWMFGRIAAFSPAAPEMAKFQIAAMRYGLRALKIGEWHASDDRPEDAFEEVWQQEQAARHELIEQVTLLADMRHPPHRSLFHQLRMWWRRKHQKPQPVPPAGAATTPSASQPSGN